MRVIGRLRPRLTYANVVSTLCLFILLGGTAWAVAANSVGTAQLKNGAVTTPKIADGAVRSFKVADHSLLAKDFAAGQIGPRQFDVHVNERELLELPAVNGLVLNVYCRTESGGKTVNTIEFSARPSESVGVSGIGSFDGAFKSFTAQHKTAVPLAEGYAPQGVGANYDLLARNVDSPNKWTHWIIGYYNDGTGHGCGVWGHVDRPSN